MKLGSHKLRVFVFMTLIVAVATHASVGQEVEGLFQDVSRSNEASLGTAEAEARDPTVIRSRHVEISLHILCEEDSMQMADSLMLNLFDDVLLMGTKEREERRSPTQYTWYGRIVGFEQSPVILVVNGENVAGNISVQQRMYQVRPVAAGIHSVREIEQSAFLQEAPPILPAALPELPLYEPSAVRPAEEATIDVLVVYTPDAANATWDIEAEIQLAVDETNTMYANSGVHQRIRLVHSAQVPYTETGDVAVDILRLLMPYDGFLEEALVLRNAYYADIVSLWVENMRDYCGAAVPLISTTTMFAPFAFHVVDRSCAVGGYTFAHELGHNMGAHHDWYVTGDMGPYIYSHGYVDPDHQWRTVMAYPDECEDHGTYCYRVPYFSNPNIEYQGTPLGVPESNPFPADNTRSLNNTAATVAALLVEGGPLPWSPTANAEASVYGENNLTRSVVTNELAIILIPICVVTLLGIRNRKKPCNWGRTKPSG